MDVFTFCVNGVLPVVLVVFVGYGLRLVGLIDDALVEKGSKLCVNALIPVSIFSSIRTVDLSQSFDGKLLLYSIAGLVLETLLAALLIPRFVCEKRYRGAMVHAAFRANALLLGLPLAQSLFGAEGVVYMSMLMPIWVIYFNVSSVPVMALFDSRPGAGAGFSGTAGKIVKNPLIIGSVLGLLFSALSIELPEVIDKTLGNIGGVASNLALLLLGGQFRFQSLRKNIVPAFAASAVRLVVMPLLFTGLAAMLGFRGARLGVLYVVFGAPAATVTYIMAKSFGTDEELAGQIVVLSTALSAVTLFCGTFLLRFYGLI